MKKFKEKSWLEEQQRQWHWFMDENNNNGIDNPTWFYSSESIIDVKHEPTINTKYIHFELK